MEQPRVQQSSNTTGWVLAVLWLAVFLIPGWVFFDQRGGLGFLEGSTFAKASRQLFPLVGLYAFFFVWSQLMLGSNMDMLLKAVPWAYTFHRRQGVFALLFALLHPFLLFLGVGSAAYFAQSYASPDLTFFVWLGYVQLTLICATAGAGLLMRTKFLRRHWRKIHVFNYLIFISVWVHSWSLGTDVQGTSLRWLWFFFGATAVLSSVWRLERVLKRKRVRQAAAVATPPQAPVTPL